MSNPVVEATGSLTATGSGTEDIVATVSSPRVLTFVINGTNMLSGDTITLRAKRKVVSGGAVVELFKETFSYPLDSPALMCTPFPSPHSATFSITQEAGTPKAFEWSVEST